MKTRTGIGLILMAASALAVGAGGADIVKEVKAAQAQLIDAINKADYAKAAAAFDDSYKGLTSDKGFRTVDARREGLKKFFATEDRGTLSILETEVRPLGENYAMLRSHLRHDKRKGEQPKEWWYTAIYMRSGGHWKAIHDQ